MIYRLLPALLLAGCATQTERVPTALPAETDATPSSTAQEDARLLAFLDAAFDAQVALSPETLTSLGSRQDYDKLGDYTLEAEEEQLGFVDKGYPQFD